MRTRGKKQKGGGHEIVIIGCQEEEIGLCLKLNYAINIVEVTVDENTITSISLVSFEQTETGNQAERTAEARETIQGAIVEKQSVVVDCVTRASFSPNGIKLAVARALEQAS